MMEDAEQQPTGRQGASHQGTEGPVGDGSVAEGSAAGGRRRMNVRMGVGTTISVPVRNALPVTARRVRYPGFKQKTIVLRKGTVRMAGYMSLPCDILLERDIPLRLEDGTTIYTDVFRPVDDDPHLALLACSPYGKEIGGQWLDDVPQSLR